MFRKQQKLQIISMAWRKDAMLNRKYLKNYSNVMLKSLDMYSDDTTLKLEDSITSEEILLKIEQILSTNPTEQQLLQKLDKLNSQKE